MVAGPVADPHRLTDGIHALGKRFTALSPPINDARS